MICTQTGNQLDVVHGHDESGKMVLFGLRQQAPGAGVITLPDPQALIDVLESVLREIKDYNARQERNASEVDRLG